MKHTIRINGAVKKIDCELGSGILDKNGREILEGDKVKVDSDRYGYAICEVFGLKDTSEPFIVCGASHPESDCILATSLWNFDSDELEIVDD